ncbi:DUF4089 domain-containing protein [Zavarzinia compransoris]|uniref:DUF4089 domain-containing protein n=1 Tax=Zavarzinia marina TaxID=2911065 RepID=UPI001F2C0FFC|nr:DUF4089 domain-containing protein [Zavarzinia marina]MCF4167147.1 DUF4089 domain-containing protein [Zavarzinia marina]
MPADFDPEACLDANAALLGLTITPSQRPGVLQFLKLAADMAALVEAAPVPADTLDLDGTFEPVAPKGEGA